MARDSRVAIHPPAVTVVDITEPTAVNAGIELIDQDAVQLQPMPLRARRVLVRLDSVTVVLHSSNRRLRTSTRVHEGLLACVTFGPHASGTVNGIPVRPGLLLAAAAGAEARFVVDPGWESITFLLPPRDLRTHLAVRRRPRPFFAPNGIEALQADSDGVRRLFDWGKRLTTSAARRPILFERRNQRDAARVEFFETLMPVLGAAERVEPTRSARTRQARSDLVATAERHALSRVGEHLSVTDLCRAVGVSERTLEYAFREILGLSPVAYLIRFRLHRARQSLLRGMPGSTTVSAIALRWGFWHFGEFSRAYRSCFGELPSDTLRRMPDGER
jgi:AraC family ethanolamine operon transcriptional activator